MKKLISLIIFVSLLLSSIGSVDAASIWSKYVAADKSYSFHYPKGWKVSADDSIVGIENSKSGEQLLMVMLPYEKKKNSQQLAEGFIDLLKSDNPNVKASNWRNLEMTSDHIVFDLTDKINNKIQLGLGIVLKDEQQAIWFSYFSPEADYYQIKAYNILYGFIASIAFGSTSVAPDVDYNTDVAGTIDRNAKAFLFVLEFALGAPFTQSQESVILNELKKGWRHLTEEELELYSQYPDIVKSILKVKQKDLEKLRGTLEDTIEEWLDETDQTDPAVKIIRSTLKSRGKVLIKGEPPLTEMSLTAYSEIIAYSRLLQKDAKAKPEDITKKSVSDIKTQVKKVWKTFSDEDREQIATAPGLWVCLRTQLRYGTKEQQQKVRDMLIKLEEIKKETEADKGSEQSGETNTGTNKPMDMTSHWSMMQIQQMTFNSYMWSRGFNYSIVGGKMW